jgi:hypothetical protein
MTKLVQGAPLQVDLSANFLFNDKFTIRDCISLECCIECHGRIKCLIRGLLEFLYDMETTRLLIQFRIMRYFFDMKYSTDTTKLHHLDSLI